MNIKQLLVEARSTLAKSGIESASLDAELLLAHVIKKNRSYLFAHGDCFLELAEYQMFQGLVRRRAAKEPVAYLLGVKEFWSFELSVNPAVLIPRADTECIVEQVLALPLPGDCVVLELGVGSGAISIAVAHERPDWQVIANDLSFAALKLAQYNANKNLSQSSDSSEPVSLFCGNWLQAVSCSSVDLIVSNPPYVAAGDPLLDEGTQYEPSSALFSEQNGIRDINDIIHHAIYCLRPSGWLVLEHGAQQREAILALVAALDLERLPAPRNDGMCLEFKNIIAVSDLQGQDRGIALQLERS